MSCPTVSPHKSGNNDVSTHTSTEEHIDDVTLTTEDQIVDSADTDVDDVKTDKSSLEGRIMSGIDVMIKKIKTNEQEENLRLRWKKLARFFDRLLFCLFASFHLLMVLFIFLQKSFYD